jgi:hypothetical protein
MYHLFLLYAYIPTTLADIDVNQSLLNIIDAIGGLFAAGIAAGAFLRAGTLWASASESPSQETRARQVFVAGIIGSLLCLGAVTLAHLIIGKIVAAPGGGS